MTGFRSVALIDRLACVGGCAPPCLCGLEVHPLPAARGLRMSIKCFRCTGFESVRALSAFIAITYAEH